MELEDSDQAVFNSSTEFLISFDSAEDTMLGVRVPEQHQHGHGESSPATLTDDNKTANDASGQAVNTVDSDHIICEFADGDSSLFFSHNSDVDGAVNSEDVWLSLVSSANTQDSPVRVAGDENSVDYADRRIDYVQQSVDISSPDHIVTNDNMTEATNINLLELVDISCKTSTAEDENRAVQLPVLVSAANQQCSNEHESIKHNNDTFTDFTVQGIGTDNNNETQTQMEETECKKLDDDGKSQYMQLPDPSTDVNRLNWQLNEHVSETVSNQQLIALSDEVSIEKKEISTSLPSVHTCAVKQELISEFPDQLFSEEANAHVAESPQLSQLVVDSRDAVTVEDFQVSALNCCIASCINAAKSCFC